MHPKKLFPHSNTTTSSMEHTSIPDLPLAEVWLPISGYVGLYEISSYGRIRSKDRALVCGYGVSVKKGQIIKPYITPKGYATVNLWREGKKKPFWIHRLVAMHFIANESCLPEVNHKDFNKQNNCIDNLEWVTKKENIRHAYQAGKTFRIEMCKQGHKLSIEKAEEMRQLHAAGRSHYEIAAMFGVAVVTSRAVIRGAHWVREKATPLRTEGDDL